MVLFVVMATIWGTTWLASAIGLRQVPPLWFAAFRFLIVAGVLLPFVPGVGRLFSARVWKRTVIAGLLTNAATYGLLFWSLTVASSGVVGLVDLALTPVILYAFAIGLKEERFTWRVVGALGIGVAGLLIICGASRSASNLGSLGIAAALLASLCYCTGSVVSRPLLNHAGALAITAAQALVATPALLLLAWSIEPLSPSTLAALATAPVVASLAYLVGFGTILAFSIYLTLLRDWGTARAGLYAFVSPVVALLAGALFLGETIGRGEILGAAMMLGAAWVVLKAPPARSPGQSGTVRSSQARTGASAASEFFS